MNWSSGALTDLRRLNDFLADKNAPAAARAMNAILEGVLALDEFPQAGRPAEDRIPYRELLVRFSNSGYVVLYRIEDGQVTIVAVRHQREAGYGP